MTRKGIILAGGKGSRLAPITFGVCKQLLPIYDKPMIYYPLVTLMLAEIRDILIITTPQDQDAFKRLLGDGKSWGISIKYAVQNEPRGIADAFLVGADFIENDLVTLVLGDNLFYGSSLVSQLKVASEKQFGATVFAYPVLDPERYGVIEFDNSGKAIDITEKPLHPKSKFAVTGLYFFDSSVVDKASKIIPSNRGEIEITDINLMYLKEGNLNVEAMGRGMAWLDTGTFASLHEASSFIRTIENRQGLKLGIPEEVAWRKGWISDQDLEVLGNNILNSGYGKYLLELLVDVH